MTLDRMTLDRMTLDRMTLIEIVLIVKLSRMLLFTVLQNCTVYINVILSVVQINIMEPLEYNSPNLLPIFLGQVWHLT